jgi:arginase
VIGLDVTIYDPELDPEGEYLPSIVDCLMVALAALPDPNGSAGRTR